MKILVVINPASGGKSKEDLHNSMQIVKQQRPQDIFIHQTTGKDDKKNLIREIKNFVPDRIIVAGGDGTIQLACRALLDSKRKLPIAIIPVGSANGMATSLSLPSSLEENMIIAMQSMAVKPVDLLMVNKKYICVHLLDIGTNAHLVKLYSENEDRGMIGYAKHMIPAIQESPLLEYTVTSNGVTVNEKGYILACTNGHKYGTGVAISNGSVFDGKFEIRIIPRLNVEEFIKAGLTIFNIFVDPNMFSDTITAQEAAIKIKPKAPLQIDGEYIGEVDKISVKILPSAVNIVVPDVT